jgi:hypothetical protein
MMIRIKIFNINNKELLSEHVLPPGAFKRSFTVIQQGYV